MAKKNDFLRPGSNEAIDAGCTCPVLDNSHGKGYLGQKDVYVMTEGCPLHWPDESIKLPDDKD